ncbi:MAG: hypothetical protein HY707_11490, partial [Ignavibacteriae bacterium]|nr:hypothetical protein [Ignavibacteriota bacterium]
FQLFQKKWDRFKEGVQGTYPKYLIEQTKQRTEIRYSVNEQITRPWIKHYFITQILRQSDTQDEILTRDLNLIEIFKTTIPLVENSFAESSMSSWRMFLDSSFRDVDAPWYNGIRKGLMQERYYSAIEQLELEVPTSNPQRLLQFYDHTKMLRKLPRVPIKLLFALPGNERELLIDILCQAVISNPHNIDVALLMYAFVKAWNRTADFFDLVREEHRKDLEEWYCWVENDMKRLGTMKRTAGDYMTTYFIYDRARLTAEEYKEVADWFLKESEFKLAYHFYYKAKEFETGLELLQNISTKEFAELVNLRRISSGERQFDLTSESSRFTTWYQEEIETLRGFTRIRTAETYKQVAVKARQHYDRETIENKYAFGELTEDEYHRLIQQLQGRKQ